MVPRLGTVTKHSDEIRKLTAIKVLFVTGAVLRTKGTSLKNLKQGHPAATKY